MADNARAVTTDVYYLPQLHAYRYVLQDGAQSYTLYVTARAHRPGKGISSGVGRARKFVRAGIPPVIAQAWRAAYLRVCALVKEEPAA